MPFRVAHRPHHTDFPAPGSNNPLQLPPNKKHRDIHPSVFSFSASFGVNPSLSPWKPSGLTNRVHFSGLPRTKAGIYPADLITRTSPRRARIFLCNFNGQIQFYSHLVNNTSLVFLTNSRKRNLNRLPSSFTIVAWYVSLNYIFRNNVKLVFGNKCP